MPASREPTGPSVAFQGALGAYSHLACLEVLPDWRPVAYPAFEEALAAVAEGQAELAMIPIENSLAGRVADIHTLLPESGLFIVGEHFQRVNHNLMVVPGAALSDVREVHSHIQALSQCRATLRALGLEAVVHADTAGACEMVARRGDPGVAAIGSSLAAEIYGLEIIRRDLEDLRRNITRFVLLSRKHEVPPLGEVPMMTSFVFEVRSVPAALYKALGGFATNGVNITKLESYLRGGTFTQAQFWADVEGHPEMPALERAFEELRFFCTNFQRLGVYPRHPFRDQD